MLRLVRPVQTLVASLLAVLLLGVTAAPSECADMAIGDQRAASPPAAHDHSLPPSDGEQHGGASGRGRTATHCLMSASCALVGVVDATLVSIDLVAPAAPPAPLEAALPSSTGVAPEPPPPRG